MSKAKTTKPPEPVRLDPSVPPVVGHCGCQEHVYDTTHDKAGPLLVARTTKSTHSPARCDCRCHEAYRLFMGAKL